MTITIIYFLLFILLFIFFLITGKYKKELSLKLDKKNHPLKSIYGTAFFLLDTLTAVKRKLFPNHSPHNTKLRKNLDKIYVGKDIGNTEYLFNAKRISYGFLTLTAFILIGFTYSFLSLFSSEKITALERTNEESSYSLEVTIEDKETQIVDITVKPKEYDLKESLDIFEHYRENIVTALLGDNSGIENIKYPLNFISQIGDEGLTINWEVENEDLIDYSGELHLENIEAYGASTAVTAHLTLGEYTASLTIPLVLVP